MTIVTDTVLLIIDMQNDFYNLRTSSNPRQELSDKARVQVYHASKETILWARKKGIPVIWTYEMHRPDLIDIGIELELEGEHCIENQNGVKLVREVIPEIKENDIHIINKRRWDAFFGTDLEIILRGLQTKTIIIIGAMAGACVTATAFSAKMRDYKTQLVPEAIWGSIDSKEAMITLCQSFSKIITLQDLV